MTDVALFPPTVDESEAVSIVLTPQMLQLAPGESGTFTAAFKLVPGFDICHVPLYSGFITVKSSAEEGCTPYQIPFAGLAYNVTSLPIFDTAHGFPIFTRLSAKTPSELILTDDAIFTMDPETNDFPVIYIQLLMGSRVVRMDLLPSSPADTVGTTQVAGLNILGFILLIWYMLTWKERLWNV
jgi:hypothetical protein